MNERRSLLVVPEIPRVGLDSTTWEQRRKLSARELIKLMGPLWVGHQDFKQRPRSLLPMLNLAGRQPVISRTDYGLFATLRTFFRWTGR